MGNLTRDPELRTTPTGMNVCKFGIATTRVFNSKDGEKREETTFVDCEAWGKTAETIGRYFSKGKPILVDGRLKFDSWEDKSTGTKRSKLSVMTESFQFVGGKGDSENVTPNENTGGISNSGSSNQSNSPASNDEDPFEDDVPF